jgi:hypothetical protein
MMLYLHMFANLCKSPQPVLHMFALRTKVPTSISYGQFQGHAKFEMAYAAIPLKIRPGTSVLQGRQPGCDCLHEEARLLVVQLPSIRPHRLRICKIAMLCALSASRRALRNFPPHSMPVSKPWLLSKRIRDSVPAMRRIPWNLVRASCICHCTSPTKATVPHYMRLRKKVPLREVLALAQAASGTLGRP